MQTSTNYRPATDGLSRIVEARFEPGIRWTQTVYISRRSLYLTFPLQADIINRSIQMIAANSVIDVAVETVGISRSTRQTARIGSYVWERNEDTCQTHHHCHRAYFTVIPWTWWKLRFSFNRLHFWSRIMVWVCGHDTCKFRRAEKAFSVCCQDLLCYTIKKSSITYISLAYFPQSSCVASTLVTSILRSNAIKAINKIVSTKDEFSFN